MCFARQVLLLVFCSLGLNFAALNSALAEVKDSAHFQMLTPNSPSLIRGRAVKISAKVEFVSSPDESVEATALLTVNGQSFKPFYTIVTSGDIRVSEEYSWFTVATGKSLTARFRLILIGNITKRGYEVVDVTRDFKVRGVSVGRNSRVTPPKCAWSFCFFCPYREPGGSWQNTYDFRR